LASADGFGIQGGAVTWVGIPASIWVAKRAVMRAAPLGRRGRRSP